MWPSRWGQLDAQAGLTLPGPQLVDRVLPSRHVCVLLKILQMKVVRLERLLKLKDQQIGELMRTGTSPSDREWPRRKSPLRGPGPTPPKATRP